MLKDNPLFRKTENFITKKVDDGIVIVPINNNIAEMDYMYVLDECGAFIWSMIEKEQRIEEIKNSITSEFDVDVETATHDLLAFLEDLENKKIIERI